MSKEELISFDTAKLAKEKGFDVKSYNWYRTLEERRVLYGRDARQGGLVPPVGQGVARAIVPTQSFLQKWLREEHKIYITVIPQKTYINDVRGMHFTINIIRHNEEDTGSLYLFNTWEKALDEGLQEALKLIP